MTYIRLSWWLLWWKGVSRMWEKVIVLLRHTYLSCQLIILWKGTKNQRYQWQKSERKLRLLQGSGHIFILIYKIETNWSETENNASFQNSHCHDHYSIFSKGLVASFVTWYVERIPFKCHIKSDFRLFFNFNFKASLSRTNNIFNN